MIKLLTVNYFHKKHCKKMTKSTGNCGFGHIYLGNRYWKISFFMQWKLHHSFLAISEYASALPVTFKLTLFCFYILSLLKRFFGGILGSSCSSLKIFSLPQKKPSRGVKKRCSQNIQQNYRRTTIPKCDFNKVAKQLYWNRLVAWVFPCKFAAYFQNNFS